MSYEYLKVHIKDFLNDYFCYELIDVELQAIEANNDWMTLNFVNGVSLAIPSLIIEQWRDRRVLIDFIEDGKRG